MKIRNITEQTVKEVDEKHEKRAKIFRQIKFDFAKSSKKLIKKVIYAEKLNGLFLNFN